jgi:hypothetical protein
MGMRLGKISGTLQELSAEELARQQGLSAAPPTPLGAQGIGASQDVAKMAGTPNQIRAMVQDSLMERTRTKDLLGESERTNGRKRYSVESLQEKMNVLEGLGSLEGRIPEYIRTQLKTATTVSVPNTTNVNAITQHLASLGVTDKASIDAATKAVEAVRGAGATPAQVADALKALKIDATITDGTTELATKLAPFFTEASIDDIKKQISTALGNFSDVKMRQLGADFTPDDTDLATNNNEIASILGLTDEQLGDMTLGEVRAQLKAWKTRNFQDVEILRDVLQDPSYSMAEKDFARQRLAEMGAVGVTSIEEKTNNLEAQVAAGDTVVVGGQAVKVSELMSDPKLKATIATALESDDELAKLAKTDAALATWIKNNKAALVPVRNELLKGTEKFAANNKVFADKIGEDSAAYSKLFDSLIPGWKDAKSQNWDTWSADKNQTVISILNEPPGAERTQKLNILAALPVEYAKTFSIANVNSIATAAKGDSAKAVELAKDWYDSSQSDVTGLNSALALQGFAPELDADFGQPDYDSFTSMIVERFTGTNEGLGTYIDRMKKLASGTAEERSKAMQMYRELGNITGAIKSTLSPTNLKSIKEFSKTRREKNALVEQKNNEISVAQRRANITPRSVDEVFELIPNFKNELNQISSSFKNSYNHLGVIMRAFMNNNVGEAQDALGFMQDDVNKNPDKNQHIARALNQARQRISDMFAEPRTVDKLLLGMSELLNLDRRVYPDGKGISSAKWASGHLFTLRDSLESAGRGEVAQLTADMKGLKAEADQANNNYSIFVKGLLAK